MSIRAMNWAWTQTQPPAKKLVLMALADYAGDDDRCWPSVGTLASKCGISIRTVQRLTQEFDQEGLLKIELRSDPASGRRMTNVYRLKVFDPDKLTPSKQNFSKPNDNLSGTEVTLSDRGDGDVTLSPLEPLCESIKEPPQQQPEQKLYFPFQLSRLEKNAVVAMIAGLSHSDAQLALDELSDAIECKSIRTSPIKWFRALVQRVKQGSFTPLGALRISARREKTLAATKPKPIPPVMRKTDAGKNALLDAKKILAIAKANPKKKRN